MHAITHRVALPFGSQLEDEAVRLQFSCHVRVKVKRRCISCQHTWTGDNVRSAPFILIFSHTRSSYHLSLDID